MRPLLRQATLPRFEAPDVTTLDAPPIVGRWYRVPSMHWSAFNLVPVRLPVHQDDDVGFHAHVDARFVTAAMRRQLPCPLPHQATSRGGHFFVIPADPEEAPALHPFQCVAIDQFPDVRFSGAPVQPVPGRRCGGRLLCPHRGADLTDVPPRADGIIVCPLHGAHVMMPQP